LSVKEEIEPYSIIWWTLYASPLRTVDFIIGMFCGIVYADKKKIWKNDAISCVVYTAAEFITVIIVVEILRHIDIIQSSFALDACWIIPSVLLIWVCASGKGFLGRILASKPLVYLGKMNYPMLCCHQVLFDYLAGCLGGTWLYSHDIGSLAYMRMIFLFVLILCVSDVLNRTICTLKITKK